LAYATLPRKLARARGEVGEVLVDPDELVDDVEHEALQVVGGDRMKGDVVSHAASVAQR
jgi:hypothetical protein